MEGFETVRIGRVVKSNSQAFPLGLELHNPTFADLLQRQALSTPVPTAATVAADDSGGERVAVAGPEDDGSMSSGTVAEVEQIVREAEAARAQAEAQAQAAAEQRGRRTFADLVERAARVGVTRAQVLLAVEHYHRVSNPDRLTDDQLADLERRLDERYGPAGPMPQLAHAETLPGPVTDVAVDEPAQLAATERTDAGASAPEMRATGSADRASKAAQPPRRERTAR